MAHKSTSMTLERPVGGGAAEPAPEPDVQLTPERLAAENHRHDRVLTALVFLLGFLLASFPVMNHDIWMSLRTGEMIAHGQYQFGVDPFAYTTDGVTWVNPAWLADLLFYGIYSIAGGAGLVLLRGAVMVTLMVLMFRMCRPNGSLMAALLCIGLAAIALSHRMLLRPELFSYLGLGLTLFLLFHPPVKPRQPWLQKLVGLTQDRLWVFLPPLFMLWANLDAWFFLGPVAVALFLLGDVLHHAIGRVTYRPEVLSPVERRSLVIALAAGLAACVINPHHVRVFQLPGELSSDAITEIKAFQHDIRVDVSPFQPNYFGRDQVFFRPKGLSIAQWCYYPLVLLGLVSFVLNLRSGSWSRFLIWLAFFLLSVWQARNIGFFAVVAGPITAVNFQDWLTGRFGDLPSVQRRRVALSQFGRILLLVVLVLLTGLTLYPYRDPQLNMAGREAALGLVNSRGALGWSLFTDASWSQLARQMHEWRAAGLLPGRAYFVNWNEQPAYAAWFDPPEQVADAATGQKHWNGVSFWDNRFKLHGRQAVQEYFDVSNKLKETLQGPAEQRDRIWQEIFRKYDISHVVLSTNYPVVELANPADPRRQKLRVPLVDLLLEDRDRATGQRKWELLRYTDGRTLILAWTGSPHWPALQKLRYDPVQTAFHETQPALPQTEPPIDSAFNLLKWLAGEVRQEPTGATEAAWHMERAQRELPPRLDLNLKSDVAAKLLNFAATPMTGMSPGVAASVAAGMPYVTPAALSPILDPTIEAEILLAIRAARRALADRPDNADAYFELFHAYSLWHELKIEATLTPVRDNPLRRYQIAVALRSAALLKPDNRDVQAALAMSYYRLGFLDVAVHHYQLAYKLALSEIVPSEKATAEQIEKAVADFFQRQYNLPPLDVLERTLRESQANFDLRSNSATSFLDAANMARVGPWTLTEGRRQYLEKVLQESSTDRQEYQNAFVQLLGLYIELGYALEPQLLMMRPDAQRRLGTMAYAYQAVTVEGGVGHYAAAGEQLTTVDQIMKQSALEDALGGLHQQTVGGDSFQGLQAVVGYDQRSTSHGIQWISQRVGLWNQMGLLALEAGQTDQAAECFQRACTAFDSESPFRPLALRYYRLITGKDADRAGK